MYGGDPKVEVGAEGMVGGVGEGRADLVPLGMARMESMGSCMESSKG